MSNEQMGELRSALAAPSAQSWTQIGALLAAWSSADELAEVVVPYVEEALRGWPDAVWREAPPSWSGVAAPLYRLTRPLALELVPLDAALWAEAVQATAALTDEPATDSPDSAAALVEDTYPGSMRANAAALNHYLTHGLKLPPTTWHIDSGSHSTFVHHGDLFIQGDLRFSRGDTSPGANLITGDLNVSGTLRGGAFEGELMVGGDIRCAAMISDADVAFVGALRARYVRLCWYDCCWAGGEVEAEVLIEHSMALGDAELGARLMLICEDHDCRLYEEQLELLAQALREDVYARLCEGLDAEDEGFGRAVYDRLDAVLMPLVVAGEDIWR